MNRALIVVDVQNDFCEGGSLAVTGGAEVARRITEFMRKERGKYDFIVATQDFHIDPKDHFADEPDFKNTWPVHCVADSKGAEFHPNLLPAVESFDAKFRKGLLTAAYSGFEGIDLSSYTLLNTALQKRGITDVDVVGIATDYCVRATALDAVKYGFKTRVSIDMCAGVAEESTEAAIKDMEAAGVTFAKYADKEEWEQS